jgi:hypothetical protein
MPFTCAYEPGDAFAVVTCTGTLTPSDIADSRREVLPLIDDHSLTGLLVDLTATTGLPTVGQLTLASINTPYPTGLRRALLLDGGFDAEVRAYETPALNRNHEVRAFTDRQQAIAWLTEP